MEKLKAKLKVKPKIKLFFKQYIIFVLLLLLAVPLVMSLFIHAANYQYQLRTVFLLQRFYITFSALVLVLLITAYSKLKEHKPRVHLKEIIIFSVLALVFFALAFSTQLDYDRILSSGVRVDDRVNFDAGRWLAPRILSDLDVIKDKSNIISSDNDRLAREIILKKLPSKAEIVWNGFWLDQDGNGVFDPNCSVVLQVNSNAFNITSQYSALLPGQKSWMRVELPAGSDAKNDYLLQGKNQLIISKECPDAIAVVSQTTYINGETTEFRNGKWSIPPFDELVIFIKQDARPGARQDANFAYGLLFKLGFVFRVLAVVSLFLAVFGIGFISFVFKKAKLEIAFSFVYALLMYWFAAFIMGYWLVLSKLVTYAVYALLKISFLHPIMSFSNPAMPILGTAGFMLGIADTCSGIESIGYFILAYSVLLLINWKSINFKKALLLFIPGLIGTFIVNILRVYLLFIIGIFISRDFALNAYHTNAGMILFIIYFVVFWMVAIRFAGKKKKSLKKKR